MTSPTLKSMPVPKAETRAIELVVGPREKPETADALSELFSEIEDLDQDHQHKHEQVRFTPELVVRRSSAATALPS